MTPKCFDLYSLSLSLSLNHFLKYNPEATGSWKGRLFKLKVIIADLLTILMLSSLRLLTYVVKKTNNIIIFCWALNLPTTTREIYNRFPLIMYSYKMKMVFTSSTYIKKISYFIMYTQFYGTICYIQTIYTEWIIFVEV